MIDSRTGFCDKVLRRPILVVTVEESDCAQELVGRAVCNGFAAGGEHRRVEQRDADGPDSDEGVGPVASARVLARGAVERIVVV
eukprot:5708780-Pleurochrysis_carterae.AAC.11